MFERSRIIHNPNGKYEPVFRRCFEAKSGSSATLTVSALGVFEVFLNGKKLDDRVLAPGWEAYQKRIAAVTYKIDKLKAKNKLEIFVFSGWMWGKIAGGHYAHLYHLRKPDMALIAELNYIAQNGKSRTIVTDESFEVSDSKFILSDIYDGVIYDARHREKWSKATLYDQTKEADFKQRFYPIDGVPIKEQGEVYPCKLITTPNGETVIDFGVNMVGYPVIELDAKAGDKIDFSFAEVLDKDGNFYNENYRSAECNYKYTCKNGHQSFTPMGTFYGWRYLRINEYPHEYSLESNEIKGVWVYSDIKRTGDIKTSNPLLNRLYENVIRGQVGNYVDVPTDCPQRNERLGWTGDAEVFVKAAAYNFNILEFFRKWLSDMVLSQSDFGTIPRIIPVPDMYESANDMQPRSAWSDAITICPMEIYLAYGDKSILTLTFDAMKKHLAAIAHYSTTEYLWTGCDQFGDWLGLDSKPGESKGASSDDIVSSAFYAYSTEIVCRVGRILGEDISEYEELLEKIKTKYADTYENVLTTQTECAISLRFGLVRDRKAIFERLVAKVHEAGDMLQTGFVGTPHILHVLSAGGESELAYKLLLRTEYPSWLYPVTKGATTMWEHWDGIRPDGSFWSAGMNSFNHYAYGAVADWMFAVAGGINTDPEYPGYERAIIAPVPSKQLGTFSASYETPHGKIESSWYYEDEDAHYRIATPVPSTIVIEGRTYKLPAGVYTF